MLCGEQMFHLLHTSQYNGAIPIGKWLSQVSKNIKLTTYKGKQLKWRCHNDATIPEVEMWFQLRNCYADFELVCIFELMTQPSENCSGPENR